MQCLDPQCKEDVALAKREYEDTEDETFVLLKRDIDVIRKRSESASWQDKARWAHLYHVHFVDIYRFTDEGSAEYEQKMQAHYEAHNNRAPWLELHEGFEQRLHGPQWRYNH